MPDTPQARPLTNPAQESVDVVEAFRMEGAISPLHRAIGRTTDLIARPILVLLLLAMIALWIGGNLLAKDRAIDASPFSLLELAATVGGSWSPC